MYNSPKQEDLPKSLLATIRTDSGNEIVRLLFEDLNAAELSLAEDGPNMDSDMRALLASVIEDARTILAMVKKA